MSTQPPLEDEMTWTGILKIPYRGNKKWIFLFIFLTLFFTGMKFPVEKVMQSLKRTMQKELYKANIDFDAESMHLSLWWGVHLYFEDVTVHLLSQHMKLHFTRLECTPYLFSLLRGKPKVGFLIRQQASELKGKVAYEPSGMMDFSVHLKDVLMEKMPFFKILFNIALDGMINGKIDFGGNISHPNNMMGSIDLQLKNFALEAQLIAGFKIPHLHVSEANLQVEARNGKVIFKKWEIGKSPYTMDDFSGHLRGDLQLEKEWANSTVNISFNFLLSEKIMTSFFILEQLLAVAKQADGGYAYTVTGPFHNLDFKPVH